MKPSKFLICENPLVDDGRVLILHTQEPVVLVECFHFAIDDEERYRECKINTTGTEVSYPGTLIWLGIIGTCYELGFDEYQKIMNRMADWYHAYLNFKNKPPAAR